MSKTVKLSDEELKSIKDLNFKYAEISSKFGQIKIEKILVNQQLERLNTLEESAAEEYTKLQEEEIALVNSISTKYGEGSVNIETGEFTVA
jgi:cyanate lyase